MGNIIRVTPLDINKYSYPNCDAESFGIEFKKEIGIHAAVLIVQMACRQVIPRHLELDTELDIRMLPKFEKMPVPEQQDQKLVIVGSRNTRVTLDSHKMSFTGLTWRFDHTDIMSLGRTNGEQEKNCYEVISWTISPNNTLRAMWQTLNTKL